MHVDEGGACGVACRGLAPDLVRGQRQGGVIGLRVISITFIDDRVSGKAIAD